MKREPNFSRRVIIYAVITFCLTMITWLAWNGKGDSALHILIAQGCFYLVGAVVFFYVLGGNIDQLAALKFLPGPLGAASRIMGRRTDDPPDADSRRERTRQSSNMGPP